MTTAVAPAPLADCQLVARNRFELQAAHTKMVEWATNKLEQVDVDLDVERTALGVAKASGWVHAPFERRIKKLERMRLFYEKIHAALEAGYAIVPNFQMNVFAIRTRDAAPRGAPQSSSQAWPVPDFTQRAQAVRADEGSYQNPVPVLHRDKSVVQGADGKQSVEYTFWPDAEFSDIAFPAALAKPVLMQATSEAMAMKLFDEIGVAVDTWDQNRGRAHGDPILLGRLLNPRRARPALTFFIGWYFDPSRL
jgi:hypothetical protein